MTARPRPKGPFSQRELKLSRTHDIDGCRETLERDTQCTWPDCDSWRAGSALSTDFEGIPLCTGHMFEVWRICRDQANARNNRTKTVTTRTGGEVKTVERPVSALGWIYYLRVGNDIKVGYASVLLNRLRSYPPTTAFLYAHRGTKNDEKVAHSMLYLHKVAGREWFADVPDVHAYIEQQRLRHGPKTDPRIKPTRDSSGALIKTQRASIVRG